MILSAKEMRITLLLREKMSSKKRKSPTPRIFFYEIYITNGSAPAPDASPDFEGTVFVPSNSLENWCFVLSGYNGFNRANANLLALYDDEAGGLPDYTTESWSYMWGKYGLRQMIIEYENTGDQDGPVGGSEVYNDVYITMSYFGLYKKKLWFINHGKQKKILIMSGIYLRNINMITV